MWANWCYWVSLRKIVVIKPRRSSFLAWIRLLFISKRQGGIFFTAFSACKHRANLRYITSRSMRSWLGWVVCQYHIKIEFRSKFCKVVLIERVMSGWLRWYLSSQSEFRLLDCFTTYLLSLYSGRNRFWLEKCHCISKFNRSYISECLKMLRRVFKVFYWCLCFFKNFIQFYLLHIMLLVLPFSLNGWSWEKFSSNESYALFLIILDYVPRSNLRYLNAVLIEALTVNWVVSCQYWWWWQTWSCECCRDGPLVGNQSRG